MDKIKAFWDSSPLWEKILIVIALPLLIIAFLPEGLQLFAKWNEKKKQEAVAQEDSKLQSEVNQAKADAAVSQGKVEQLESDKQEAMKDESKKSEQAAADFYNHLKPDGK